VLRDMDGAWLVHLAAHGSFRADNPLFSALDLDDGPLTVVDLEQLRRAPYRLVLSACEVGLGASVGTDELLGVVGALLMLGSAGVVASLTSVPDGVVADLSVLLHQRLLAGATSAQALRDVRACLDGDLLTKATAASFLAFGAA
jgi:CHAT domain-containing protein